MAWVAPRVWAVSEVVTAAKMNEISSALSDLDRRTSPAAAAVVTSQTTTSSTYTDLATVGPAATAIVGTTLKALVSLRARLVSTSGNTAYMSVACSGATTFGADDANGLGFSFALTATIRIGITILHSLTAAGSTTFTAKYRSDGGTMTASDRGLTFQPLGS